MGAKDVERGGRGTGGNGGRVGSIQSGFGFCCLSNWKGGKGIRKVCERERERERERK